VREWVVIAIDAARRRITVIPAFDAWETLLNASFAPGTYAARQYLILHTTAGVTGTFGAVSSTGLPGFATTLRGGRGSRRGRGRRRRREAHRSVVGVDRDAAGAARAAALRPRDRGGPRPRGDRRQASPPPATAPPGRRSAGGADA
jgi:hypothetical protein